MKRMPILSGSLLVVIAALFLANAGHASGSPCDATAEKMFQSCQAEVIEEFKAGLANCINFADADTRAECRDDVRDTKKEDRTGCSEQREARHDACELLGEKRYDTEPLTDPALTFVHPDTIGFSNPVNPYFSLKAGHTYVLRAGENFEELVVVHVTDQSREILGENCRLVVDIVVLTEDVGGTVEYEAVEVTDDLYAQEISGDVYYCGELARNYEDGVLRDLDGSFEAGMNFAKSGVLIKAAPQVGDVHRQEFLLGEAEDLIRYVDTAADVPSAEGGDNPLFPCASGCLKTEESIPPEPEAGEFKYYLPGTGFVLGVELEDDEVTGVRDELVCYGDSLDILENDPACGIADAQDLLETLCTLSPEVFCEN